MKHIIPLFFIATLLISCNKKDDSPVASCTFYEEHFSGLYSEVYATGEKAAQRFNISSGFKMNKVVFEMDVMNSTSIKLSVYKAVNGQTTPEGGELLGSSTITSSQVQNTGKIEFKFASPPSLGGSFADYYFILEGTGGSFELTKGDSVWDLTGEIWEYYASSWHKAQAYDYSFSVSGSCLF